MTCKTSPTEAHIAEKRIARGINKKNNTKWNPPETAPRDGTEILIKTRDGIVSAWFCDEKATNDANDNAVYDWVCFDDKFTIDGDSDEIIGWLPLPNNNLSGGS